MLLPQTAEYALRAVLHVAAHEHERPVRVDEVASALRMPRNYLSKTMHQLARADVLRSARGPGGGFRLAVPAAELTIARVVAPFVAQSPRRCLLGHGICGQVDDCTVHERWAPVGAQIETFFRSTTVAALLTPGVGPGSSGAEGAWPFASVPLTSTSPHPGGATPARLP